jgi:hypothetical protein
VGDATDNVSGFGLDDLDAALAALQRRQVLPLDRGAVRQDELQHTAAIGYQPEPPFLGQVMTPSTDFMPGGKRRGGRDVSPLVTGIKGGESGPR